MAARAMRSTPSTRAARYVHGGAASRGVALHSGLFPGHVGPLGSHLRGRVHGACCRRAAQQGAAGAELLIKLAGPLRRGWADEPLQPLIVLDLK